MKQFGSSRSGARAGRKKGATSPSRALPSAGLDEIHDAGGNLTPYLDWAKAIRPGCEVQRVNVDFPVELLRAIDREAKRVGVSRQAFIKLRLADALAASR
jgi:hypothetical protein